VKDSVAETGQAIPEGLAFRRRAWRPRVQADSLQLLRPVFGADRSRTRAAPCFPFRM